MSGSHLDATPKKPMSRKNRVEDSPGLLGDSNEAVEAVFEPPPTFEYRARKSLESPSPEQLLFRGLSMEKEESPFADPITSVGNSQQ